MILAIRTDSMEATIALVNASGEVVQQDTWEAGRALSRQLPPHIEALLRASTDAGQDSAANPYAELTGVIAYEGPGSFTSLRIGLTVANTIAHEQHLPIVGTTGEAWLQEGVQQLHTARPGTILTPVYGGEANISKPKK